MVNEYIKYQAQLELARREFWEYCKLKAPKDYREDRAFLKCFCDELQAFYESEDMVLVINAPPRHYKSRTAQLFVPWAYGKYGKLKIMTGSYNETLSTTFAKSVRDQIQEIKADEYVPVFNEIFPAIRIKRGNAAAKLWGLIGGHYNYLATSPGGTATGFGCDVLIIDDLIKNDEEAYNEDMKEAHWKWFTDTMLSRLEEGGKVIIIMTRWATDDLAGRALAHFKEIDVPVRHVNFKAVQSDGSMLCNEILSYSSYRIKSRTMGADIVAANYQQEPIDIKGRLYTELKTYDYLPRNDSGHLLFTEVRNYTDTADEGDDYLCSINYGVYNGECYVLNVLYTKAPMEETEPATAEMLIEDNVRDSEIESNNGGRGFARAVQREMDKRGHGNKVIIRTFHQNKNKKARILSNATWIMQHLYFPRNWADRWPEYHDAMIKYQKEGKNAHDDGPDATTGIAEYMTADIKTVAFKANI